MDGVHEFETVVNGVIYRNANGSSRQKIIAGCRVGEMLYLDPEPDNKYDSNAVRILRANLKQIGYLPAERAAEVAPKIGSEQNWAGLAVITDLQWEVVDLEGDLSFLARYVSITAYLVEPRVPPEKIPPFLCSKHNIVTPVQPKPRKL